MFLNVECRPIEKAAAIDLEGGAITYGELHAFTKRYRSKVRKRALAFHLCENKIGSLAGYYAAMDAKVVPLLLSAQLDRELLRQLILAYQPEYLWIPNSLRDDINMQPVILSQYGYLLVETGIKSPPLYDELSLLLTTSGSTGSPKLVRHSYRNLEANAENIAAFFELSASERPMVDLPMHYTYGLSVINSHLYAGATLLLSQAGLMKKEFWDFFRKEKATSFTGVPYSYEVLKKLRFFRMELPSLKTFSQGGGKMPAGLLQEFVEFAEKTGRRFICTYGQTEGSARMAYLPAEFAGTKLGSIGKAIPGGKLSIRKADLPFESDRALSYVLAGELVYEGPNVTLGYAENASDLLLSDERHGILCTGDIAGVDEDGFYYILGRKSRFLKLYGSRVSLDECEQLIRENFGVECACTGKDDRMIISVVNSTFDAKHGILCQESDTITQNNRIRKFISEKTGIFHQAFYVCSVLKIPKNEAGKVMYANLNSCLEGESHGNNKY